MFRGITSAGSQSIKAREREMTWEGQRPEARRPQCIHGDKGKEKDTEETRNPEQLLTRTTGDGKKW